MASAMMAVGLLTVTVLGLLDATTDLTLFGALALGPVVAATAASPRSVLGVGLLAVAWVLVLGAPEHWTGAHWFRIFLVVVATGVAVSIAVVRERYLHALLRAAHVAEVAQHAILRPLPDRIGDMELAVRYLSAADGAQIGGDVYDAVASPWGLRVFVADVRGKGLEAVEQASVLVAAFREGSFSCASLDELATRIDESYERSLAGRLDFATGVILEIDGGDVRLVNCGHPDPLLVRASSFAWLRPSQRSRPFGLRPQPLTERFAIVAGDRILLYTDGLIEARDAEGSFFDVAHHAVQALVAGTSLQNAVDAIVARMRKHARPGLGDDVVVLVLQRS
jgi:phosphoserine phosphatase RsbU/P